jgi:hypothetical protein
MADWIGAGTATADRYRDMAEQDFRGVSPEYERIALAVAGDRGLLDRLDALPPAKRQPNLLLASVRYLGGPVSSYEDFARFVRDRWDDVAGTMLARRTQTNEPRRCATLLPALAMLPQPLALLEVGASAGLCLYPDRMRYRYMDDRGGEHIVGDGPLELSCAVSRAVPIPSTVPHVAWRRGLDLEPLNLRDDDAVRWLEALVWPGEGDRLEVLRAAVEMLRAEPPPVIRGDLISDLLSAAEDAPPDATLVVYHSAVLAYLDDAGRRGFREELAALRRGRSVVWLANEAPGVVVDVAPAGRGRAFVLAEDEVPLAFASGHGDWLEWFDASLR